MGIYKMKKHFEHNGYKGSIEHSIEDMVLYGEILFIKDLVTYEADNLQELEVQFKSAVDDYLETCEQIGKEPDKVFSGSFQVRISPELHRIMALQAHTEDKTQSKYVAEAIQEKVNSNGMQVNHVHNVEHNVVVHFESKQDIEIPHQENIQWAVQNIQLSNTQQKHH